MRTSVLSRSRAGRGSPKRPRALLRRASPRRGPGGVVIASYTSTYDQAGRLVQTVEGPQSATTTFTYDAAGRLLSENRTGAFPYVSTYTYEARGLRATAFRSEDGVPSHNGTYTYDQAGRLTSVADTVTMSGLAGTYTWNADGTLASMPGPGYRRVLSYDEEGRLTAISRLQNGALTTLFQYGYGYDGARRWRKDLASGVWDWYPCGVACCAGDLVTLRSTNGGVTWNVLERRLDKAPVLDGTPFLASKGSGTQRIGSEQAVTDSQGVRRSGSYGTALNSMLNPLRGDAGVEETLRQLQVNPKRELEGPPRRQRGWWSTLPRPRLRDIPLLGDIWGLIDTIDGLVDCARCASIVIEFAKYCNDRCSWDADFVLGLGCYTRACCGFECEKALARKSGSKHALECILECADAA